MGQPCSQQHLQPLIERHRWVKPRGHADRSKPAPDIFSAALETLKVSPAEAITVGDTRFDIEAAAKVGLKTIALTCGGTVEPVLRQAGAIAVFRDPAHLLAEYDKLLSTSTKLIRGQNGTRKRDVAGQCDQSQKEQLGCKDYRFFRGFQDWSGVTDRGYSFDVCERSDHSSIAPLIFRRCSRKV
ncbi:MAG: Phosphoglycolate phosphatase [Candidatus Udaeobacter sp.]|nr:MAG: Phosphoglycolate phosphatase [Candidatus Udaeobacter sp.]